MAYNYKNNQIGGNPIMTKTGISISGLAETNTNWSNNLNKHTIQRQSKRFFANSSLSFSNNHFQPMNLPSHAPSKMYLNTRQEAACKYATHIGPVE
jgi:hypothetical protein